MSSSYVGGKDRSADASLDTSWRVIQSPADPEMYAVKGAYLVADRLPIEDANLIAASRALLTVAKTFPGFLSEADQGDPWIEQKAIAIAKAEGRALPDGCCGYTDADGSCCTPMGKMGARRLTALEAKMLALLKRYHTETPLGHQPHMISLETDRLIAKAEGRSS